MKKDKGSYNISPGAWARATYEAIKAEEAAKELEKSREQRRINDENWKKAYTPQLIRKGVYDVSNCFHPEKIYTCFPGIWGAMGYSRAVGENKKKIRQMSVQAITKYADPASENLEAFKQAITEYPGGVLIFPIPKNVKKAFPFPLKLRDTARDVIKRFKAKHADFQNAGGKAGNRFSGAFTFESVRFNKDSLTYSLWGVSNEAAEVIGAEISKRLSRPFVLYVPRGNKTIEVRLIKVGEVDFEYDDKSS
ncbi:MAG: hypothetical protein LBK69_03725 [Syntrophomonadaceae bacterium]|jgi:hypothetical protein|nr:hypothetical protein [Syntrophomonadaceae bacterium]